MRANEEAPGRATGGNSQSNFEGINLEFQDTGQQPHESKDSIYGRGVWLYREAGWRGVLPLPPVAKPPPPRGFTGYDGAWSTDEQIAAWSKNQPADANLMLRVNYGVIGIDVDAYGNKTGGRTLEDAEKRWGPLPPTFRSSSRGEDVVSGIRVYRVPEGMLFRTGIKFDDLGIGHIDIIQPHHRHITAWPSIHPNGCRYRWYGLDGLLLLEGQVPRVQDLPELTPNWVEQLTRDAVREEIFDGSAPNRTAAQRARINEELYQQLISLLDNGSPPDRVVAARLDQAMTDLTSGTGTRYDTTRDHVAGLMRLRAVGRVGVPSALDQLYKAYVLEVTDTRPRVVAEAEFLRSTEGAAALVAASSAKTTEQADADKGSGDTWTFTDGASFILDIPDTIPALWGDGQRVLWPEGESLMICGLPGLGKTTLAGMLISAQLGGMGDIGEQVLDLTVAPQTGLAWWHGYWREVIDANLDAQAYWIATPSGTITDRKLMYAWLYGDVIHARSPRSPVIRDLDIDQRYCAAAPGIARICDRVIYTQIMVEGLIDKGLLTVDPPRHRDRPDRGH